MPAHDIGERIARIRQARHLTQNGLAQAAKLSASYVQKIESGHRPPSQTAVVAIARALGVDVTHLDGRPYREDAGPEDQAIHAVIPEIRRVMLCYRNPEAPLLPPREFEELYPAVEHLARHRRDGAYVTIAPQVPALLGELSVVAHMQDAGSEASREAYRLLAQTYRCANSLAHKLGYHDLSAAAIERTEWAARRSEDPVMIATAEYLLAGAMIREGAYGSARRLLRQVEADLADCDAPDAAGMRGAVLLKRAVAAACAAMPTERDDCLGEAADIAARLGGQEGIYSDTPFGQTQVEIYRASTAIITGDYDTAVREGGPLVMPADMPAERSSHHHIDMAHARVVTGDRAGAWEDLQAARRLAPQHTRKHPRVRDTVSTLVRLEKAQDPKVAYARWAGVMP